MNARDEALLEEKRILFAEVLANLPNVRAVQVEKVLEDFRLPAACLMPVGIIVNEILTNAMKHAFKRKAAGKPRVEASMKDSIVRILVGDDGAGMGAGAQSTGSFGLTMLRNLAEQPGVGSRAGAAKPAVALSGSSSRSRARPLGNQPG